MNANLYISPEEHFVQWYSSTHNSSRSYASNPMETHDMLTIYEESMLLEKASNAIHLFHTNDDSSSSSYGMIYVDYGFCFAAVETKQGISLVTKQNNYSEDIYWPYDVSEQIEGTRNDEEDITASATEQLDTFIQWLRHPGDRLDMAFDVFRTILKRITRETLDRLGESEQKHLIVCLPPYSPLFTVEWESLFSNIREKCTIHITNHACCHTFNKNERFFDFYRNTYIGDTSYLVEVFETDEHSRFIAEAFAFDKQYNDDIEVLTQPALLTFSGKKENENASSITSSNYIAELAQMPKSLLFPAAGIAAFLRNHPASFRDMYFTQEATVFPQNGLYPRIAKCYPPNVSFSAAHVCGKMLKVNDTSRIALNDMVTITTLLENPRYFRKTNLQNKKGKSGYGRMDNLDFDASLLPSLPANYPSVAWKCNPGNAELPDYFSIKKCHSLPDIHTLLMIIASHYDYCTTEDIASDFFYFNSGRDLEPSALLTAKIYLLLLKDDAFKIIKRNELIHEINVDSEAYAPIDVRPMPKSTITFTTAEQSGTDTNKSHNSQNSRGSRSNRKEMNVHDMHLSVRAYTELRRAGIIRVGQLINLQNREFLMQKHFITNDSVDEIEDWLVMNGLWKRS